jgi:hypothetical protein
LGGGGFWAAGCCAIAPDENSVKIVQNIRARMKHLLWAPIVPAPPVDRASNVDVGGQGNQACVKRARLTSRS